MTKSESRASVVVIQSDREALIERVQEGLDAHAGAKWWYADEDVAIEARDIRTLLAAYRVQIEQDRASPLERMVALDEEIEAEHPGWMTGQAPARNDLVARLERLAVWADQSQHDKWCKLKNVPVASYSGEGKLIREAIAALSTESPPVSDDLQ